MVQERYGVQLPAEERSRLRQMIRSGRSSTPGYHPGTHSAQVG